MVKHIIASHSNFKELANIKYQASGIQDQVSNIGWFVYSNKYQVSCTKEQVLGRKH